ncbi:FHA domain-containing protein [Pseudomonas sp. TH05]|uniref:FHA domain-containing protein n=1 Tax=unclassified Pseudomonas TaxID=196821 RepID=UPI0019149614|nr:MULTISPECIES: FHA domain-containing protein [unclassified Pseudomonas]MBK5540713.1 FHA domain-containing protein [Pseudomonas sp. TH07]MBK5557133.1 FHA domain-containing protein [Pseudomonas sp. TH05]
MAILLNSSTGALHALKSCHVFGRLAQRCDSPLTAIDISLLHATVRWSSQQWLLTDQSRNGCLLNEQPLTRHQPVAIKLGDEIRFGMLDATPWRVVDLAPPADLLIPLAPHVEPLTLHNFLVLSDEGPPYSCIYRTPDGCWMQETSDGAVPLRDGELLHFDHQDWRLSYSSEEQNTLVSAPSSLSSCMRFKTSLDEEHVQLTLFRGAQSLELGERTHHYLLLLLARQRLADAARGFDLHTQGWLELDDLVGMLGLDKAHLNIQVFRLRKQFQQAVSQGLIGQDFIERRRGGVRLGSVAIEVWRGSSLEGRWQPATSMHLPPTSMSMFGHELDIPVL